MRSLLHSRIFGLSAGCVFALSSVALICAVASADPGSNTETLGSATSATPGGLTVLFAAQPLLLMLLIIAGGMALGAIRIGGLTLGASGVLFSALLAGHLGHVHDWALPEGLGKLGLVLFVYAVGLDAGPTFFRAFASQGKRLAILALVAGASAATAAFLFAWYTGLPPAMAAGIFAGSMTSTPALASAIESSETLNLDSQVASIGYGLAYPIGVVVTLLFVQVLPRLLRIDLEKLAGQLKAESKRSNGIGRHLIEIANPNVFGKRLHDIEVLDQTQGQITRVLEGDRLVPIRSDHVLEEGQVVMLVANAKTAQTLTLILGRKSHVTPVIDADRDRMEIVITAPSLVGKTLRQLHLRTAHGITISRIERYGVRFVPSAETPLAMADRVTAIGPPDGLAHFLALAGHRTRKLHETDLMSLAVGLSLGVLLGMIPINLPGIGSLALGLAGGPLLAGLLFGHFGRFMGVVGYMPLAARMFTQQLGLAFFLADAGFAAGGVFMETLQAHGPWPFLMALVVGLAPLAATYAVARFLLQMNLLEILGGTCGAMTSTAGLGAITSKTDSDVPVINYAAAYPIALVLMTILARVLVMVIV